MKKTVTFIFLIIIWSVNSILNEFAAKNIGIFISNVLLRLSAFVFLIVFFLIRKKSNPLKLFKKYYKEILLFSLFNFFVDGFTWVGLQYSSALNSQVISKLNIVLTLIIGVVFLSQKLRAYHILCCLGLLSGGVLVCIKGSTLSFNIYDIFFICGTVVDVVSLFFMKKFLSNISEIEPFDLAMFVNFITGIVFIVPTVIVGDYITVLSIETWQWLLFALLMVVNTVLLCTYYFVIKKYEVFEVKMYLIGVTILTAILSVIFFDRVLTWYNILGVGLVAISVLVYNLFTRKYEMQVVEQKEIVSESKESQ